MGFFDSLSSFVTGPLDKITGSDKRSSRRRGAKGLSQGKRDAGFRYGQEALDQLRSGAAARVEGFEAAERQTSKGLRTAKRQAVDRNQELAGTLAARFGGGSGQTTAYDNAVAGLSSRTTRQLADIDLAFSDALSGLSVGKGQAKARGASEIASGLGALGSVETQYYNDLLGLYDNPNFYSAPHDAFDILGLAASAGGAAAGGR